MITKTQMTLDMYLRQAGLKTDVPARPQNVIARERGMAARFDRIFDLAASPHHLPVGKPVQGTTLADYQRRGQVDATSFYSSSTLLSGRRNGLAAHPPKPLSYESQRPVAAVISAADNLQKKISFQAAEAGDHQASIQKGIADAARKYNLPSKLIQSVIRAESNFLVDAVSPAGAQGLMQLMPATARELGVTDSFDVQQNIDGGARYLRQMLDRFDGDLKLALAAYNAGPGAVARHGGKVPYQETREYVRRVLHGMGKADVLI